MNTFHSASFSNHYMQQVLLGERTPLVFRVLKFLENCGKGVFPIDFIVEAERISQLTMFDYAPMLHVWHIYQHFLCKSLKCRSIYHTWIISTCWDSTVDSTKFAQLEQCTRSKGETLAH